MSKTAQHSSFSITMASFSLLFLVFLVFLNSMAEQDKAKAAEVIRSLQQQFPSSDKEKAARRHGESARKPVCTSADQARARYGALTHRLSEEKFSVKEERNQLLIAGVSANLFEGSTDQLRAAALGFLAFVTEQMKDCPVLVSVEVREDASLLQSKRFPSPLELAGARAASVCRYFIDAGMAPAKLRAAGLLEETAASRSQSALLAPPAQILIALAPLPAERERVSMQNDAPTEEEKR